MKRKFSYGFGATITIIVGIGSSAIAYGGGLISFDLFNLPAWILGPLGVYTLVFALISGEVFYYLAWSVVLLAIAVTSALYKLVNVIVVLGILLITLAAISSFAYLRSQKRE